MRGWAAPRKQGPPQQIVDSSFGGRRAMKVSVFGLGYVGSVSAASFAADGHEVIGVDVRVEKGGTVKAGRSPIVEPGLDDLLQRSVAERRLRATTSTAHAIAESDVSL